MSRIYPDNLFSFAAHDTQRSATQFWQWAFSDTQDPMLRGLLVEYLVCQHLIDHAEHIAGPQVRRFTQDDPYRGNLTRSLRRSFEFQHAGDVTDLQLTWGLTVEIKSTATQRWSLKKTQCWNWLTGRNLSRKAFQANLYILAELNGTPQESGGKLDLGETRFHVLSREDLEELAGNRNQVGYKAYVQRSEEHKQSCDYQQLPGVVQRLAHARFKQACASVAAHWRLPDRPSGNAYPLAVQRNGVIEAGYYCGEERTLLMPFTVAWQNGFTPDWKAWEALGMRFEPEA